MKRTMRGFLVLMLLLPLAGCDEAKQNVVWSPDGRRAAVIGTRGLYLCDENGKLSGLLIDGAEQVRWTPDGTRIVVARTVKLKTWHQVAAQLNERERAYAVATARELLEVVPADPGERERVNVQVPGALAARTITLDQTAMMLYARDELRAEVEQKFGSEAKKTLEQVKDEEYALRLVQVYGVGDGGTTVTAGPVLARSLSTVMELRLSPEGRSLAFTVAGFGDEAGCDLYVTGVPAPAPANAAVIPPARCAADRTAVYPDWSHDGRSVLYVRANNPAGADDALRLGTLRRLPVADEGGNLRGGDFRADEATMTTQPDGSTNHLNAPGEDVAGLAFTPLTKVRSLKDGTILFSGVQITLPTTEADMPTHGTLFAIDPSRHGVINRIVPAQSQPHLADAVWQFELSPDQKRVAIAGTGGQVTMLNLATGAIIEANASGDTAKSNRRRAPMVATWRTNEELCYGAYNEAGREQRPSEVYLWSEDGKARRISGDWPNDVVQALRPHDGTPVPISEPATAPSAPRPSDPRHETDR